MHANLSSLPRERHPFLLAMIVTTAMLPSRSAAQPADPSTDADTGDPRGDPVTAAVWELAPGDGAERSPAVATALSAGITMAAALAVMVHVTDDSDGVPTAGVIGFAVGPTVGHWYSGRAWTLSTSARLGGAVLGSAGLAVVAGCMDGRDLPCELGDDALIAGTLLYAAATVYEIATAPRSASERHGARRPTTQLVMIALDGNDRIVPGVAMRMTF